MPDSHGTLDATIREREHEVHNFKFRWFMHQLPPVPRALVVVLTQRCNVL